MQYRTSDLNMGSEYSIRSAFVVLLNGPRPSIRTKSTVFQHHSPGSRGLIGSMIRQQHAAEILG